MPWYHFSQNNSGGTVTKNANVDWEVFIEANSAHDANHKAEDIGIYFHGVSRGVDCECCGDRWHQVEEDDKIFNLYTHLHELGYYERSWVAHFMDGTVKRDVSNSSKGEEKQRQIKVIMTRNPSTQTKE